MSYNIDSVKTVVLDAHILAKDVVRLLREHGENLPEVSWLKPLFNPALDALASAEPDRPIPLKNFDWCSTWSGNSLDALKEIAKCVHGSVDAIFTWEGGDSFSGLRIVNGEVTECDVKMVLVPRKADGSP